jgi:hypothetical protein
MCYKKKRSNEAQIFIMVNLLYKNPYTLSIIMILVVLVGKQLEILNYFFKILILLKKLEGISRILSVFQLKLRKL